MMLNTKHITILILIIIYLPIFGSLSHAYHYTSLHLQADLWQAFWQSLQLAMGVATTILPLSVMAAFSLFKRCWHHTLNLLLWCILIIPDVVLAVSWRHWFAVLHVHWGTLWIAQVVLGMPMATFSMVQHLRAIHPTLYDTAKDLGASHLAIAYRLILPCIRFALISNWLLCVMLSMDDTITSYFLSQRSLLWPTQLYAMSKAGDWATLSALHGLLVLIGCMGIGLVWKLHKQ
jgi:ABC-type spermidine/putrescine transport system permease subunit II